MKPRRLIGMVIALAALLAAPASASALGLSGLVAEPPVDKDAGAHADFHIHLDLTSASDDIHDIRISLPPGQIGNPLATPQCTLAQFNGSGSCPANTQVGTVVTQVTALGLLPLAVNGKLFNLVPNPGEPARFGVFLSPTGGLLPLGDIRLQSSVELRPDFGLDTVIDSIPNTASGLPLDINSMDITLFGGTPHPAFARNPTSCDQATTNFLAHSYAAPSTPVTGSASYTPTNCGALDFSPSFSAVVSGVPSGAPTNVITSIDQDADEAGLLKAVVQVPSDFNPNAALLGAPCDQTSFEAGNCPPGTVVGSAIASSPLLSAPLTGPVELVAHGTFPDIGLDLRGQLHLLLKGSLDISKTTTFDGLPDIPIAHFQLTFTQPPGLLGTTRDICVGAPPLFHADFTGYNGATTSVDAPATVQGPCGASASVAKKKCKKHKKKNRAAEAKKKRCKKHKKKR
jgi:hypothetical protein